MTTLATHPRATVVDWTAADLVDRFGPIPLWRVRLDPPPGTATEADVTAIHDREKRSCELVDGVLVEKTVGMHESFLAMWVARFLWSYLDRTGLGILAGEAGPTRLAPGLVRIPDVSFVAWDRFPGGAVPADPFLNGAPDLAVEVLSPSNTAKEMETKLRDYFAAGSRLVWYIDPASKTVKVFTSPAAAVLLKEGDILDGGDVLPGFALPLAELFEGYMPKPPA